MSKILVVHPDNAIGESVKSSLVAAQHAVRVAQTGEAALEVFKAEKAEFVIINHELPGTTSFQLFGEIRRTDPKAKVLVLSLADRPQEPGDPPRFGIRAFKPEQILELVEGLQSRVRGALVRPERGPSRIVVVDDNPLIRDMIEDLLTEDGYEVTVAENGAEGLKAIEKVKPHLILLDIDMPEMSGVETLKRIRKTDARVGVVMITGNDTLEMMEECRSHGAYDYLTKPFDLEYLKFCVHSKVLLMML